MRRKAKEVLERMALALGFSFLFGIIFLGEGFRNEIGLLVDKVFGPLTHFFPIHITIFILAIVTGIYAALIQKYTVDWEKMREIQREMREFQKAYREAQKTKNKYKLKKLEEQQAKMMERQGEMMRQQFKPMAYISIVSIPLWLWMYWYVMHNPDLPPLVVPLAGEVALTDYWFFIQYWILWYIICSIAFGQFIRKLLNIGGV